jgi:Carboxypeptidase regulatory-like domain/TonB-dependent Receptor Plug Domain
MLHRMARAFGPAWVFTGFLFAGAPLAAQVPVQTDARLQGVVVDQATYQPVDSATVSLVGTDILATTGKWGSFAFPLAPLGRVALRVSAPGHPGVTQDVEVRNGGVVFVQIVLPSVAATLSELWVNAPASDNMKEVARSAADLLADQVPRMRVNPGSVGATDFTVNLRATSTLVGDAAPLILIDGVMMSQAFEALERIPASEVRDIQVLRGNEAFQYPYSSNGVINVRTKRGR